MPHIQARRAPVIVGNKTINGFQMPDGSYRISQTQACECVGIPSDLFQSFLCSKTEFLDAWDGYEAEKILIEDDYIEVIPLKLASSFWMYRAFILNDDQAVRWVTTCVMLNSMGAEQAIEIGSRTPDAFRRGTKNKSKAQQSPERVCVLRLKRQLGGKLEVSTPVGRIDLLTQRQVIEVKEVSFWKSALGQVLAYGDYYPHHGKRIHLFGGCDSSSRAIIEKCCGRQCVDVSWENTPSENIELQTYRDEAQRLRKILEENGIEENGGESIK